MIRNAVDEDVDAIAALAQRTREKYEQYEKQFWRISPDAAEAVASEDGTFLGRTPSSQR